MFEIIGAVLIGLMLIFFAIAFTRGEPEKKHR